MFDNKSFCALLYILSQYKIVFVSELPFIIKKVGLDNIIHESQIEELITKAFLQELITKNIKEDSISINEIGLKFIKLIRIEILHEIMKKMFQKLI